MKEIDLHLKSLIKSTESRYINYGVLLREYYQNSLDISWYKEFLRDMKDFEERKLDSLKEEITWLRIN